MRKLLVLILVVNSLLFSADSKSDHEKKLRIEKQIKKEMEKEKKYAKEQTFYKGENYDFKGAEVNMDSLKNLPDIELDDLDMNSVYD